MENREWLEASDTARQARDPSGKSSQENKIPGQAQRRRMKSRCGRAGSMQLKNGNRFRRREARRNKNNEHQTERPARLRFLRPNDFWQLCGIPATTGGDA
jgi:hypothetical protein